MLVWNSMGRNAMKCDEEDIVKEEIHVDFVATDELLRRGSRRIPKIDQEYIVSHARWKGIKKYDYTDQEHSRLKRLAEKARLCKDLIEEFDRDYRFIRALARKLRTGVHNAMTGMCYDIAICNYARIATIIEKTESILTLE